MEPLFGVETEYGFSALDAEMEPLNPGRVLSGMLAIGGKRLKNLPDGSSCGMFLSNGGRVYVDSGNHPEVTTPECSNPWDLVRYIQAGERILADLATAHERQNRGISETVLLRTNVDYGGTGATWGCHESYLHLRDPLGFPAQLIPHLVSRIIFTGAGGFNNLHPFSLEFTLSPRVWHLRQEISGDSTHDRGIFHTKDEPLSRLGYHRLHIICGESLCSELANWLKVGTTALVVALIDGGVPAGEGMRLRSSVRAMRRFASDPRCRSVVKLRDGGEITAIGIQRHYLRQVEAHLNRDFMPPFAEAVCEQWHAILDKLENAPEAVETQLDWAIKRALYANRARRHGVEWESLPSWSHVLARLSEPHRRRMDREGWLPLTSIMPRETPTSRLGRALTRFLRCRGLKWDGLSSFVALRKELFEIDTRFGQLGDRGIFQSLDSTGVLSHRVPGVDNIEQAMVSPPATGRARLRGEMIRELSDESADSRRYLSSWERICDYKGRRILDLSDPFATTVPEWKKWTRDEELMARLRERPRASSMFRNF